MRSWTREGEEIPPDLGDGEKGLVPWFHDESTYRAHNRRLTYWIHESETAGLYKKGEGVTLMVADIVSPNYGFLQEESDGTSPQVEDKRARVTFRAGKQRDGYFCNDDVVEQLEHAIEIAKSRYPNKDHLFIFDNATTHTKLPDNAPVVSKMTLGPSQNVKGEMIGPSGEKIKVKMAPAQFLDGTPQDLYYPANHPIEKLRGAFKGLKTLLEERGIPRARELRLTCPTVDGRKGCPHDQINCCARRTMANQPDFRAQKSILQLLAESHGCSLMYLPKYHCELNPIEQCWGTSKRVYRDYPMSSSEADLKNNMLNSLDTIKLESIRRFATRSRRFVHAYHDGLSGAQAAWANKLYHGHRVITEAILQTVDDPE
ncbi:hypothetical protein BDV93DRAFT_566760 [Ceratobasidium sp. AG-I]|nr:hypothetical protein BDV93DRAFT_566760 [Ceratobasidium sp. AG-I]